MILETYTFVHVVISLVGIFTGLIVLFGLLAGKRLDGWTKWFLITTVATSVTGFVFPFHGFTPAIALGIMSLIVLAVAIFARYPRQLTGHWRWIYVVSAVIALYFNVFVGIVQAYEKIPALKVLARRRPSRHSNSRSSSFWRFSFCLALSQRSRSATSRSVRLEP